MSVLLRKIIVKFTPFMAVYLYLTSLSLRNVLKYIQGDILQDPGQRIVGYEDLCMMRS